MHSPYTPNGYIHPQFNSNYTPNRNIDPQCNRLCVERVYRSVQCRVSCIYYSYKIMVEKVMHITSEYEEGLPRCQYVRRLSFGRRMLTDDGAPNTFSLTLATLVLFFLITYEHSLFSIHSSCKCIRTILIILRLDLALFF